MQGDAIHQLPTDKITPSEIEMKVVQTFFDNSKSAFSKVISESKSVLLTGLLFFLLSFPPITGLLRKYLPFSGSSDTIFLVVRTILFIIIIYILSNFSYCKKG